MRIDTMVSWGYLELIETFFSANNLCATFEKDYTHSKIFPRITIVCDDESESACTLTLMSIRHLGVDNMLCDYLMRCNIPASFITEGSMPKRRDMKELDKQWEEHKKLLFSRD